MPYTPKLLINQRVDPKMLKIIKGTKKKNSESLNKPTKVKDYILNMCNKYCNIIENKININVFIYFHLFSFYCGEFSDIYFYIFSTPIDIISTTESFTFACCF